MRWKAIFFILIWSLTGITGLYAGEKIIRRTTDYPAPYGEYQNVKATNSFSVPVKNVTDKTQVVAGEMWIQQ